MVPMGGIEPPTSPLPRECSTPELHGPQTEAYLRIHHLRRMLLPAIKPCGTYGL